MTELAHPDFRHVACLFEAFGYDRARRESYLADERSRMFVDDALRPTVALVLPGVSDICLMAGDPQPGKVRALLEHVSALPEVADDPLMISTPSLPWEAAVVREFGYGVSPNAAISFRFANFDRTGIAGWADRVPVGCRLVRMDRDLASRASEAAPEFPSLWADPDDFVARGMGFCLVEKDRILSIAYSMARPGKLLEMAVATAADVRGRGYSPLTSAPLIEHCLDGGIEPIWTCFAWNQASQSVARKLGFVDPIRHTWFKWTPFNADRRTIVLPAATLGEYAGGYSMRTIPAEIRIRDGDLLYVDELRQVLLLGCQERDRFFFRDFDFQLEFTRDGDGRVDGFVRHQFGRSYRAERV